MTENDFYDKSPSAVNLTLTLNKGTAIVPAWVLVLFAGLFVVSSVCSIVVLYAESRIALEVRMMQLYEEDIENVLIRNGIANRSDFATHSKGEK